ncbi:MAG: aminopeptidase N [Deltaproteobacteria bacterium]|nr:aminopeptidase N [Deltaproteobacteria bacterium]
MGGATRSSDELVRDNQQGLSLSYSQERAKIVSKVHYQLYFSLDKTSASFFGISKIRFDLSKQKSITLDFEKGTVLSLTINGKTVLPTKTHYFIMLERKFLRVGSNEVVVEFRHDYSKNGVGFYRFCDPQDGLIYLYSDFEPYDANLMFPCFDQPDLKATFMLTVDAPLEWEVISTMKESTVGLTSDHSRRWTFPKTPMMSTYIFSLHAGPYHVWEDAYKKIPLRLLARKSFASYVDADFWFLITKQGLRFFSDYFHYDYPFYKYDQLIVPDFNSGAMENIAAVTFNEAYIPRGAWTRDEKERLAEVILHEMAHMWFGDLVTMKWWDDLWLNESFATYMAFLAQAEATDFKEAWHTFFEGIKSWAYWEDEMVTTHPIVAKVPHTAEAMTNFDGITYGKGASVLKQLAYFLGPEKFRAGVSNYFKKYAYQNTKMKDFIESLSEASDVDLKHWTREWLQTQSLNSIQVLPHFKEQKLISMDLLQKGSDHYPKKRKHRTQIGIFKKEKSKIILQKIVPMHYEKGRTAITLAEKDLKPHLIYPNCEDYDYVKVKLDAHTLEGIKSSLSQVSDDFSRLMFWRSLWDMVRSVDLSIYEYHDLILKHLPLEQNVKIARSVAQRLKQAWYYLPAASAVEKQKKTVFVDQIQDLLWKQLEEAKGGSDFQKLWLDTYIKLSLSDQALERLHKILAHKIKLPHFELDQDRRWAILVELHRKPWEPAQDLLEKELKRDHSEAGQKQALACEVIQPKFSIKKKWFQKIIGETNLSLARTKVAMSYLFPKDQMDLHMKFSKDFYHVLPMLGRKKDHKYLMTFCRQLAPAFSTPESIHGFEHFLKRHTTLPPVVAKELKIAHQEDERSYKIHQLAQAQLS